jgi:hypothetical protein
MPANRNQIFPDAAVLSLLRKAYVGSAVLAALSLASKFRLLVEQAFIASGAQAPKTTTYRRR